MRLLEEDLRPRDILTRQAFENAITVVVSMGGSTNSVLHLMAIAHEAQVDLSLQDFDRISRSTPYIADMRPAGRFVMADLDGYGGVSLVMKRLLKAGLLHGDAMTVTSKTLQQNIEGIETIEDQEVVGVWSFSTATLLRKGRSSRWPGNRKESIKGPLGSSTKNTPLSKPSSGGRSSREI